MPIADGGTDALANLRPSCARCNRVGTEQPVAVQGLHPITTQPSRLW